MTIRIIEVEPGAASAKLFDGLPEKIYTPEDLRKLPADTAFSHPWFHKARLASDNEDILGRIALFDNQHLIYKNEKAMCAGYYECADNEEAAVALLNAAAKDAKASGAHWLIGPMNGSTWDSYRFSDSPGGNDFFLEPFNKPWYGGQFEKAGFEKIARYFSSLDRVMNPMSERTRDRMEELLELGFSFRPLQKERFNEELEKIFHLSEEAFRNNFLYTPLPKAEFMQKYKALAPYTDARYVWLAEDAAGAPAAFVFCIPNILNPHRRKLIIKTLARRKGRLYRGLGEILLSKVTEEARDSGFEGVIHALMYEDGSSVVLSGQHAQNVIKTYSLYALRVN
ncbi:MAG: hypothetical protein M3Q97_04745 [Bacteroidota bacterium]|nr:hypothetical protein [Bacteroidota bacterium]